MSLRALVDITTPYSWIHAWTYENIVADAARDVQVDELEARFLRRLAPGARVLDVGAGGGRITAWVAERRPDLRVEAVEPAATQRARAERATRGLGTVSVREGDVDHLGAPEASVDGALSCGAIKHWPDRARGLRALVRACKPGAPVCVTEVDRSCRFDDARAFVARFPTPAVLRPVMLANFRTFVAGQSLDLDEARSLAAGAGLREVVVDRIPGSPLLLIAGLR
ncbi:MAG: class I SAM-dependent methyltransferase [Myxococcales bacterium]|nr:class I SAM-dependent methyltransferase [Myxococcales bacterium]MCB9713126.1 class I SAM-dependent methyltransferase [Myxococcales bacterium]